MKNKIFLFLLLSSGFLHGQDSVIDNKFALKIAPLAIFDIYSGMSPRIGVEYKLKKNYSLYNEIGTYIPNANGMSNNIGVITKLEFKAYLNSKNLTVNRYLSAELLYKQQSYYTYDSISSTTNTYIKDYFVSKKVGCFTIKYGTLKIFKSKLLLDKFIGIGLRYKISESSLTDYENNNVVPEGNYGINVLKNKAGIFTYFNFDLGIKIGYRFR